MTSEKGRNTQLLFMILTAVAAFSALASGCKESGHGERQQKAQSSVTIRNGETVLELEPSVQQNAGITATALKSVLYREQLQAYGTVLLPDGMIDLRSVYTAAKAAADKDAAVLDATRREYERLKKLNADNRNVSDKALQAAGAALKSDEADANASDQRLNTVKEAAAAKWGGTVSEWIFYATPEYKRLAGLKDVLIRVTLPSDKSVRAAPEIISIQIPEKLISARLIGPAPNADPRTETASFLYLAHSHAPDLADLVRLVPGMSVQALMPVGPEVSGVVVPFSAVLWQQGKAWAYIRTDREHFARREVPVSNPVRNGYFVPEAFRPGEKVVISGAQILLSQESRPSGPAAEEED
jgi:hypothetical protein